MKQTLILTTINIPYVLKQFSSIGPNVEMYVAGDRKSPSDAARFCAEIPNCHYYSYEEQEALGYACSDLLGADCIQRRNIALLEAIKYGAESVVSVDDDNAALSRSYFGQFESVLSQPFTGLRARGEDWFDVGQFLDPISPHRGIPPGEGSNFELEPIVNAKIGVAAGVCLGNPDISAVTRIAKSPDVHRVSEILRAGVAMMPGGLKTVWNSQNTAFIRALAPAFFMLPWVGRYDDILASLIMQRVMRSQGLHAHFGQPFVHQQRNAHNLFNDLRAEMLGMEHIEAFAERLDNMDVGGGLPIDQTRRIWEHLKSNPFACFPYRIVKTALAFCDDMEKVL